MKKSDGPPAPPHPMQSMPTMQLDAFDPDEISLEDNDDVRVGSEPPARSRLTPPPLPPGASLPPAAPTASVAPSIPPPGMSLAPAPKKSLSPILLLFVVLGVAAVGGGVVAVVVRSSQPATPTAPVVSVVHSAPTPAASASASNGVMTIPVIEFDNENK